MADIFISYSSKHRDLTRALADALKAEGRSVWWDKELEAYASFRDQIDAALSQARVVVVIWSEDAVASLWVDAEATKAFNAGKLVNATGPEFRASDIPLPFNRLQAENVENIQGLTRAIAKRWAGDKPERLDAAAFYEQATGAPALSPKQDTLSTVAHVTPALLLNARIALAPYLDVHGLRAGLGAWAREGRPVSGRLVHGPGGLGKTRLMAEVCADLRAEDWAAGFIEAPDARDADIHRQAIEGLIDSDRTPGLLLVLDYAERRQEEAASYAQLMVEAARHRPTRPLRMVLLARAAGEWWDRAVEETPALTAVFTGGVTQMVNFAEVEARARLFDKAGEGFQNAIAKARRADPEALAGWSVDARPISDAQRIDLSGDAFARPLMIQIAALLQLQGETPDAGSIAALLDGMLGLERKYWTRALGAAHTDQRRTALARGTVQTTLVGGATKPDAEALLLSDSYFARSAPADVAEPLSDMERLYGDGAGGFIPLEPDLMGEHLAGADGDARLIDACLAWAGEDQERRRTALTVLQRATRAEHGTKAIAAQALLEHVVRTRGALLVRDLIDIGLKTPGELATVLECVAPTLAPNTAEVLHEAIPKQTLLLSRAAAALATRACAGDPPSDEAGKSQHAGRLNDLGNRLSDLGRREDALQASAEAVEIYRELAAQNRDAFLPNLAASLNNLGNRLSDLGRHEEALTASTEAVEIYRVLVAQSRDAYLPDLARSLNNLGIQLSNLGRHEEALPASTEAVEIYRELAVQNRDAFLPDLATSLNNLGIRLSNLGRHEDALPASTEAVEIYRELAAQNRDAFLPNLAASLNNLSNPLSDLGRHEEALTASTEAVEIYRVLVAQSRDAYLPDLARSLNNLGNRLSNLGRHEEALTASTEAVEIYRVLVAQSRDAYLPDLARSLNNLGIQLSNLGRHEEALPASTEAVEIYRELAVQNRDAYLPDLATSLNNLGIRLSNLGRHEDALPASTEAVEIYRELAAQNRDAFIPDLARSLGRLGAILSASVRASEAIKRHQEAADLLAPYAQAFPGAFNGLFTDNLRDLMKAMRAAGRSETEISEMLSRYGKTL